MIYPVCLRYRLFWSKKVLARFIQQRYPMNCLTTPQIILDFNTDFYYIHKENNNGSVCG